MSISNSGNVGIGTISPEYKLDVSGTIRAKEVKVDLKGADFVFEDDYDLIAINELEKFIDINKHLPEMNQRDGRKWNRIGRTELETSPENRRNDALYYRLEQANREFAQTKRRTAKIKKGG